MFYGFIQRDEHQRYLVYTKRAGKQYRYAKAYDNFKDCAATLKSLVATHATKKTAPRLSKKDWSVVA